MHAGDRAAWLVQPDISVALQRVLLELLKPCWTPTPNQYRRTSYCHVGQDSPVIIWTLKQRKEQFNCQNSWQSQADERFSRGNPDHAFQVVCLKHVVKVVISNHSSTKTWESLYSLIWDFRLSQIDIWTTTTWSNVWVVLPKPSWYEFLIGFLIWTPASKYLHLTIFSNICVILSMFLYL